MYKFLRVEHATGDALASPTCGPSGFRPHPRGRILLFVTNLTVLFSVTANNLIAIVLLEATRRTQHIMW